jgi:Fe2+ or Zn2+ uptake regulation protein
MREFALASEGAVDLETLEQGLRDRGGRMTIGRHMILKELARLDGHISAGEICRRLVDEHPTLDPSTVYRTLDTLCSLGLLRRTHIRDGIAWYHHVDVHPHQHLVCRVCGRDDEVSLEGLDEIVASLRERHGFIADLHYISLTGHCTSCQPGSSNPDQPSVAH